MRKRIISGMSSLPLHGSTQVSLPSGKNSTWMWRSITALLTAIRWLGLLASNQEWAKSSSTSKKISTRRSFTMNTSIFSHARRLKLRLTPTKRINEEDGADASGWRPYSPALGLETVEKPHLATSSFYLLD